MNDAIRRDVEIYEYLYSMYFEYIIKAFMIPSELLVETDLNYHSAKAMHEFYFLPKGGKQGEQL
jgi:hypothetical protein